MTNFRTGPSFLQNDLDRPMYVHCEIWPKLFQDAQSANTFPTLFSQIAVVSD